MKRFFSVLRSKSTPNTLTDTFFCCKHLEQVDANLDSLTNLNFPFYEVETPKYWHVFCGWVSVHSGLSSVFWKNVLCLFFSVREGLWLQLDSVLLLQVLQVKTFWFLTFEAFALSCNSWIISFLVLPPQLVTFLHVHTLSDGVCICFSLFLCVLFAPQVVTRSSCGSLWDRFSLKLWGRCPHRLVLSSTSFRHQ